MCERSSDEFAVLVESLVRGVSVVQLVFGLSNPRQSANFPLVKPKIRARIGQNVCPIRGEFAAGERFHQDQNLPNQTSDTAVPIPANLKPMGLVFSVAGLWNSDCVAFRVKKDSRIG